MATKVSTEPSRELTLFHITMMGVGMMIRSRGLIERAWASAVG